VGPELKLGDLPWLVTRTLDQPHDAEARDWHRAGLLHLGEAEAMALARQERADWFLTDDSAARVLAEQVAVEVHGSLGVLLWGAPGLSGG
jgi:predicted nucleic acid-binding protein